MRCGVCIRISLTLKNMKIEDCVKGKRVRINLGDGTGNHYARIDSVQDGLLNGEKVVMV